jgi:hypothetical protein
MKYMGDDRYSWAIFRSEDVKGLKSPITDGSIIPVVSGMDQREARWRKEQLEKETAEKIRVGSTEIKLHEPSVEKIKPKLLEPVRHLGDLYAKAATNPRYQNLAIIAAENLGGSPRSWKEALQTLEDNANCIEHENAEEGESVDGEKTVVDEINFVRDIEANEYFKEKSHEEIKTLDKNSRI